MSKNMTAIGISQPGGPEVLLPVDRPIPEPGDGEVLIKVHAAGVNRPDCLQRQGSYPPPPGASDLPGLEVAGTVAGCGKGVTNPAEGDEVCALISGGGYAEYCSAPAVQCLPIPKGFDFVQAAALPETFFTVWSNVFDRGGLTSGETTLIHGGASGIGTTAIQLARAFGARVFATAGSDEKCALAEKLGAEKAINYQSSDFAEELRSLTAKKGVNLILDIVGAGYFERNIDSLAPDGRLVIIAVLGGARAEVNLAKVMMRRLTITGSTLRARDSSFKGNIAQSLQEHVWPLLESGRIAPVIQAVFSLQEAGRAHEILDANQSQGKIVLTVDQ